MPSFPTIFLEVLSKIRGVNVQQFLQVPCPTKSLGGCHVQQFLVAAISGISFQQHPFWGGASLLSNMWIFPKRLVPQAPDHPKNHSHKKSWHLKKVCNLWFTDTNHHAPPGPPVPGTMSEQNLPRFQEPQKGELRGEFNAGHKMSDAWEILTRTIVNLIKIDFLIYILCIIVHNTYDNTVQVYSYIHICICIYCCCCDHL